MQNDGIKIHLDKERTLLLDFKAMRRVEKVLGENMIVLNNFSIRHETMLPLLWAGLVREDPALTMDAVEDLICLPTSDSTPELMKALVEAWQLYMPVKGETVVGESESPLAESR